MNNGLKPLLPVVLVVVVLTLLGAVLVFAGVPMAGTTNALRAAIGATGLTLLIAYAYVHQSKTGH